MDNEIYQLVKHLNQLGLDNLTSGEKLIKLWQRAVKKWNKSHKPTSLTLEEVEHAFKDKWPQIYGTTLKGILYLSFSYIDYYFTRNSKGQVCGGIWPRINEMPRFPVNMTAEQIVDLASLLRTVPEKSSDREKDEAIIKEAYHDIVQTCDEPISDSDIQHYLYPRLQTIGTSQYMLGLFEKSFETLSRALLCYNRFKDECNRSASEEQAKMSSASDKVKYGEFYTMLADNLVYMFHWEEAQWCFETAYDYLNVYEEKDWQEKVYPENMRQETDQSARCAYLDMTWRFAEFYIKSHRPSEAISLLEKAEAVAKDMDEIEAGRWANNLKSITDKLTILRENANK